MAFSEAAARRGSSRGRSRGRGAQGRGGRRGEGFSSERRGRENAAVGGRGTGGNRGRGRGGALRLKKQQTKLHQERYAKARRSGDGRGRGSAPFSSVVPGGRGNAERRGGPRSDRTADVDIHIASKVSSELRADIALFRTRNAGVDLFGPDLEHLFSFVPPSFVQQHLPTGVASFRTYLSRFKRGTKSDVAAFTLWYEWASYEANKGKSFKHSESSKKPLEPVDSEGAEADVSAAEEGGKKLPRVRQVLAQSLKEREHVRALLQMCLRHNSARRHEGQHALVNHLKAKLTETEADCRSLERLRATAHHSVIYALSRLLLGMATDDFAMIVLHCHALYLVLRETAISASVLLSLLEVELALATRMKAVRARLEARWKSSAAPTGGESDDDDAERDAAGEDAVDPDDINDPTKGERNQRLSAAVFALAALVAAKADMSAEDARRASSFLCFCYVEQKATRVLSANALFALLRQVPHLLNDEEAMQWATFAFFFFPKMEYYRPEAVQFLLRLMEADPKPRAQGLSPQVSQYMQMDPLEPTTLEQVANALFRKEQVTAVHPMIHPVWNDLFELVLQRCAAGESLKEHLSTVVHTVIAPYRRGSADHPRRVLFQALVTRLGQIAVQSEDATQRAEMLHMASKSAGYGKRTTAKPTAMVELKQLPISSLEHKVGDLLQQYRATKDSDPAAVTNRTWALRELRNCLSVPVRTGVSCPYVDDAVKALMEFGFFPRGHSRDDLSKNRCIYLFSEVFSFTFHGPLARPKATVRGLDLIASYLAAESAGRTRYETALKHKAFRKARNRIVAAMESSETQRSVLFYEPRDMEILLTMLFLLLSVDDPANSEAVAVATSVVPDLVQFYQHGTLETLDLFFDVLMSLIMRVSAPLQVMPLMTCIRRIATGYVLRFARNIRNRRALDLILAPLRDGFHTDSREEARQRKAKAEAAAAREAEEAASGDLSDDDAAADTSARRAGRRKTSSSSSERDSDEEDAGEDRSESEGDEEKEENSDDDASHATAESDEENGDDDAAADDDDETVTASSSSSSSGGDSDSDDTDADEGEGGESHDGGLGASTDNGSGVTDDEDALDDDDEVAAEEEEAPTQQYIDALKGMVGADIDLDHRYPTDTASKEKSDVVRAIQLAARTGLAMRSPLVVHVFQVLLAVCRENVKASDDVVFHSATAAVEMLLLTKNRYFGHFLSALDLFQILADIQSYSRKLNRALLGKEHITPKAAAQARRRMAKVKALALRVLHFLAMLAYKNHAGDDVRITLAEFYKSVFCDRGWDMTKLLPGLKKDLFHYRQGFAWVLLGAALDKFNDVVAINGPQRVRVFTGCCIAVEAMLPRLAGLPPELKENGSRVIRGFLQSVSLEQVYEMKHTLPYTYLHAIKMVVQYNSRVHLDTEWVTKEVVSKAVDDDSIQLSAASIRTLAALERLLELTPRARETKAPVPVKVLYQQFEKVGAKEKGEFYRKAKRVRTKVLKALLAYRNDDPTDEERAKRRRRREELRVEDRLQRQLLRESHTKTLTKEEREEKRKRILMAKQERIAKNRERKRRLHEARLRSFERWRQAKLAAAAATAAADADEEANDE